MDNYLQLKADRGGNPKHIYLEGGLMLFNGAYSQGSGLRIAAHDTCLDVHISLEVIQSKCDVLSKAVVIHFH